MDFSLQPDIFSSSGFMYYAYVKINKIRKSIFVGLFLINDFSFYLPIW